MAQKASQHHPKGCDRSHRISTVPLGAIGARLELPRSTDRAEDLREGPLSKRTATIPFIMLYCQPDSYP